MTAFTAAIRLSMSWPRWIKFTSFHLIYLWFLLKLYSHLRLRLSRSLFPLDFSGQIPLRISFLLSHHYTFLTSQLFIPSPNNLHQDKRALDGKVHSWTISHQFSSNKSSASHVNPPPSLNVLPIRFLHPSLHPEAAISKVSESARH
jgi:hypothetical protein